jgi:hypothetical protein
MDHELHPHTIAHSRYVPVLYGMAVEGATASA